MALVLGGDVDREPVARLDGRPKGFLDDDVRRPFEFRVGLAFVSRVQPNEQLNLSTPGVVRHRANQHAQHMIVMRIQLARRRRHGDELARRIGADAAEERVAGRKSAFPEIQIPLRHAGTLTSSGAYP